MLNDEKNMHWLHELRSIGKSDAGCYGSQKRKGAPVTI